MSGELNTERDVETLYDSGFRPDLSSARHVLAFLLTPIEVIGPLAPEEVEPVTYLFNEAKRHAFLAWQERQRLGKTR